MKIGLFFQYIDAFAYSIRSETEEGQKENKKIDRKAYEESGQKEKDMKEIKRISEIAKIALWRKSR